MAGRRAALERLLTQANGDGDGDGAAQPPPAPQPAVRAGAVRAMGLALGALAAAHGGERVEELDPALVDPSFVRDRLDDFGAAGQGDATGIAALAHSIAEGGQAVPILVRPHPAAPGRYQIAYGHRRWAACRRLGRTVRAVVRELSDADLVVAQGRENSERRDLSFIERAQFARALCAHGHPRAVAGRALGVDKSELARLVAVAAALPDGLAAAIGRAGKAGRPRWLRLAHLLDAGGPAAAATAAAAAAAAAERHSDARFRAVLDALEAAAATATSPVARPPVRVATGSGRTVITIDETAAAGFGRFVEARLAGLLREFLAQR